MKVAVLMGGNSSEREVSLSTGRAVMKAVETLGLEVIPCPYEDELEAVIPLLKNADVVFIALHGGEGENGGVQKVLDENGMKYTGSDAASSALAMDKNKTKLLLGENDLPTASWLMIEGNSSGEVKTSEERFTYPVVVKPNADGSTMGVAVVHKASQLDDAVEVAQEFGGDVMIEKYIPGREITVGILEEVALPVIEIKPSHDFYDYKCKYTTGMSEYICPAELSSAVTEPISLISKQIADLIGCRHYCRVDFRLNPENEFFCLEVNTLPGLTDTSLVPKAAKQAGLSFEEVVKTIFDLALE